MTEQEAMEIIMQVAYDGEFPTNSNEAFGIACKALEKQTPKEPKKEPMYAGNAFESWDKYNCPNCNNFLHSETREFISKYKIPKYCNKCGQAIKWE